MNIVTELVNLMGITMKFHAEEIFERKELGKKEK